MFFILLLDEIIKIKDYNVMTDKILYQTEMHVGFYSRCMLFANFKRRTPVLHGL